MSGSNNDSVSSNIGKLNLTIWVSPPLKKSIKECANLEGKSVAAFVRDSISDKIKTLSVAEKTGPHEETPSK
jgi:hypothetical protein